MRIRRSDGFTVIETLIALYLVTFVVVVLGGFSLRYMQSSTASTNRTLARALAVEQLENIRRLSYQDLASLPSRPIDGAQGFTRSVTVTRVGGPNQLQDYKVITVEVQAPGTSPVRLSVAISAP